MSQTKQEVLKYLKSESAILSGSELAERLNVSRTAIWKAVKELQKEGYTIESGPKGYRYQQSDIIDPQEIIAKLARPLRVKWQKASPSTMEDAKAGALAGDPDFTLYIADNQIAARGRFHRPFFAVAKKGIYMSLLLRPNQNFTELPQYTVLAAVAVAQAIDAVQPAPTTIKWVNDIFLNGKKVCGILSEAVSDVESGEISQVVIGIGLNFSIAQQDFPAELREHVTSVFANGKAPITRNEMIARIWQNFEKMLADLPDTHYLEVYREKSNVLGQTVSYTRGGKHFTGKAVAINDLGELIVQTAEGEQTLRSGEISLDKKS